MHLNFNQHSNTQSRPIPLSPAGLEELRDTTWRIDPQIPPQAPKFLGPMVSHNRALENYNFNLIYFFEVK